MRIYSWINSLSQITLRTKKMINATTYMKKKLYSFILYQEMSTNNRASHPKKTLLKNLHLLPPNNLLSIFKRFISFTLASLQSHISWVPSDNIHVTIFLPKRLFHSWDLNHFLKWDFFLLISINLSLITHSNAHFTL